MQTAVTRDIRITVETGYQEDVSGKHEQHVYAYRITIENHSHRQVRLLRRHWFIIDSTHPKQEVEGEGVVGLQPIINPGKLHQYVSGCSLNSEFGKMYGEYLMEYTDNGQRFPVTIPEFYLISPYRNN